MNPSNLSKSQAPGSLSRIGGAAQGGSAKPREEREEMDRENGNRQQEDSPSGAGGSEGKVGGNSNDSRTDQERSSEARKD